jgi:hypothetical protein
MDLEQRLKDKNLPISEVPSDFGLEKGIFSKVHKVDINDLETKTYCRDNHDLVKDPQGYVCRKCGLGFIN